MVRRNLPSGILYPLREPVFGYGHNLLRSLAHHALHANFLVQCPLDLADKPALLSPCICAQPQQHLCLLPVSWPCEGASWQHAVQHALCTTCKFGAREWAVGEGVYGLTSMAEGVRPHRLHSPHHMASAGPGTHQQHSDRFMQGRYVAWHRTAHMPDACQHRRSQQLIPVASFKCLDALKPACTQEPLCMQRPA